jgi:hypothetical protein
VSTRAPRPHEELVLLLAGTRARRAATAPRARALLGAVDWDALLDALAVQGLVPLLGGRLLELADAPARFADAVRGETAAAGRAGALLELATLRVAAALEAASVPNVPLKEPLLTRALHGDPAVRVSRDIDVLVARGALHRAARALAPLGWRPQDDGGEPVLHLVLAHDEGLPEVELHWRVHWYEDALGGRVLARAAPAPDGVRRLAPLDELATLLLYHARDGLVGLRHPIDVAAWWDARGAPAQDGAAPADGPLLAPVVAAHPALAGALGASAAVLDRLVGVPAQRLVPPAPETWAVRRAVALANPLMEGEPQQITAEIALVDGLLAPAGGRGAFLRRRALPSARELPERTAARPLAVARTEHVLRLARRCSLAVIRPRARLQVPPARSGNR